MNQDNKLEIHVPQCYTEHRPAFLYAHESFQSTIAEHPIAGQFPEISDGFAVKAAPSNLRDLAQGPGFPSTVKEMIDQDVPQLSVKIINYLDATFVITRYPHITWDAFGYLALKKMLQFVLDGREDEIPPMLGASTDILTEISKPYRAHQGSNDLLQRMSNNPTERQLPPPVEPRIICLPADVAERLESHLRNELAIDDGDYESLRSDELMTAWAIQQVAKAPPTPRSTAIMNLVNVRLVFPAVANANGIYTQNMLLVATNNVPPELTKGSVGEIALSQRSCISDIAAPEPAAKFLASIIGAIEANLDTTAMGNGGDATPLLVNNLANLTNGLDLDFSSALVRQGQDVSTRTNPVGTVDFGYITDLVNPFPFPKLTNLGRITGDTTWMFGELPARAWELIEEYVEDVAYS